MHEAHISTLSFNQRCLQGHRLSAALAFSRASNQFFVIKPHVVYLAWPVHPNERLLKVLPFMYPTVYQHYYSSSLAPVIVLCTHRGFPS